MLTQGQALCKHAKLVNKDEPSKYLWKNHVIIVDLQFNPSSKHPVAHSELNLIVARERRGQKDFCLSREYRGGVNNSAILILNSKHVVGMIDSKSKGVVLDVNHGWAHWTSTIAVTDRGVVIKR